MRELIGKILKSISDTWKKLSLVQRIISIAVIVVVAAAFIMLSAYNSSPSMISVLTAPIKDENLLTKISARMDAENIAHKNSAEGMIYVADVKTAQRVVSMLVQEGLMPVNTNPWDVFKMDRWTVTDFERNVQLRNAIAANLKSHLESLNDIDSAQVTLVIPDDSLFKEDQKEVTASIIVTPKPNSDLLNNPAAARKKVEGIVKLVKFAVPGLKDDFITITDNQGNTLNDFAGYADFDRLELGKRQLKIKKEEEKKLKAEIIKPLEKIFGEGRVSVVNIDIDLNMSKKSVNSKEHYPITVRPDNPLTSYDDSEFKDSITISKNIVDESFKGNGFNPEGPPGAEGQTPAGYKDLSGMVGEYKRDNVIENYAVNERNISEEMGPYSINRITVSVAIDGLWKWEYDDNGAVKLNKDGSIVRTYEGVSDGDIVSARSLVENAVGYSRTRGDSVTVQALQFDRTKQHLQEDEKYRAKIRLRKMITYSVLGLAALAILFIIFKMVLRELERRRKLKEEELARQHQAMREAALRSAEEEGVNVEMSVEERARQEMQELVINMSREHPEDVAQLIRTWLLEE